MLCNGVCVRCKIIVYIYLYIIGTCVCAYTICALTLALTYVSINRLFINILKYEAHPNITVRQKQIGDAIGHIFIPRSAEIYLSSLPLTPLCQIWMLCVRSPPHRDSCRTRYTSEEAQYGISYLRLMNWHTAIKAKIRKYNVQGLKTTTSVWERRER